MSAAASAQSHGIAQQVPAWSDADIRASQRSDAAAVDTTLTPRPAWATAAPDVFLVLADGGGQLVLLDGSRFDRLQSIDSPRTLHGEPRLSPDGRHAFFAAAEGWILKFDLWAARFVVEVRAGPLVTDFALSSDGQWLLVGTETPHRVVLLDSSLALLKSWPAATRDGLQASRIAEIHEVAPRRSFVVALRDIPELWEISHDPKAEDFYDGLVHDFRMGEGVPTRGFHNPRRILLPEPLHGLHFTNDGSEAIGSTARPGGDVSVGQVVNLDVRRRITVLPIGGRPAFDGGIAFVREGLPLLAVPRRDIAGVAVIDTRRWTLLKEIAIAHPARRLVADPKVPLAWLEGGASDPRRPEAIDLGRLELAAAPARPEAAPTQLAFSGDGRHVLAITTDDKKVATLTVYDGRTLALLRRLALPGPVVLSHLGPRPPRPRSRP